MGWIIITLILLLITAAIVIWAPSKFELKGDSDYRTGEKPVVATINTKKIAWIPFICAILLTVLLSFTVVGTRNVGVEKFASATTGRTLDPGLHWKAPWNSVSDIDGTIQPEEYKTSNPIKVKIGDLGEAEVALAYRWRLNPDHADDTYKDYRKAEDEDGGILKAVRKALVSTNIKSSLNEELATYNPLAGVIITANMTPEEISRVVIPPIPYADLNKAVKKNLALKVKDLGGLVEIQSVNIEHLKLPEGTQNKINQFNTKIQESKNTLIDISIKAAQARGNDSLAKSVDNSPNVLVSKCFDSLEDGSFTPPAGFSCWPGGGSAIVVPAK